MSFRNNSRRGSKPSMVRLLIWAAATFCLINLLTSPGAAGNSSVSPALEQAVLAENWAQVIDLLKEVNPQTPSPVLRLIKGHACLALNRNNESICLFLSVASPEGHQEWEKWAQGVIQKTPDKPIGHYFLGDARARLKEWDLALKAFAQALALKPQNALVLNGRGATFAAQGNWDHALVDFDEATRAAPALADAHASLGALWVQRRQGPQAAVAAYNQALKYSPNFALGLNGRGCAYFALGKWDKAFEDLKSASLKAGCFNIALANIETLARLKEDFMARAGDKLVSLKPGMSTEAINKYVGGLDAKDALKNYAKADWNNKWCNFWAGVGDFLSGRQTESTTKAKMDAQMVTAPIPGVISGGVERTEKSSFSLKDFGQNLAATSRNDAQYWSNFRDTISTKQPEVMKMAPAGATAEELQHAYVDLGKWLDTGYGLAYYVLPVTGAEKKL